MNSMHDFYTLLKLDSINKCRQSKGFGDTLKIFVSYAPHQPTWVILIGFDTLNAKFVVSYHLREEDDPAKLSSKEGCLLCAAIITNDYSIVGVDGCLTTADFTFENRHHHSPISKVICRFD